MNICDTRQDFQSASALRPLLGVSGWTRLVVEAGGTIAVVQRGACQVRGSSQSHTFKAENRQHASEGLQSLDVAAYAIRVPWTGCLSQTVCVAASFVLILRKVLPPHSSICHAYSRSLRSLAAFLAANHFFSNPFDRSTPSHLHPGRMPYRLGSAAPI